MAFQKGHIPWNKDKTKKELPVLSNSGVKKGNIPWNKELKGTFHHTEEHKKKMRILMEGKKNPNWKDGVENNKKYKYEQRKKWREENQKYIKEWKENNLAKIKVYSNNRRARIMKAIGSHTFGEWEILKAQYDWTCPACGKKEPDIRLSEDHIIPLSKGGSNNIENIQPLCRSCNSRKHTKTINYKRSQEKIKIK